MGGKWTVLNQGRYIFLSSMARKVAPRGSKYHLALGSTHANMHFRTITMTFSSDRFCIWLEMDRKGQLGRKSLNKSGSPLPNWPPKFVRKIIPQGGKYGIKAVSQSPNKSQRRG